MEHEELDRLLAEYATGGLSEEDKKTLFTAALADQELFEQLMEEDALREAIELPGARNRLIDSLQEDLVMAEKAMAGSAAAPSVLRMPSPAAPLPKPEPKPEPAKSNWLAWAAGIGIVFVSGAITYVVGPLLGPAPTMKDIAQVYNGAPKDTKPFVQPPPPAAAPRKVIVEEPPKIIADARKPMSIPRPVSIPLPSTPPPAEPVLPKKEAEAPEVIRSARAERDRSSQSDVLRSDQQRMVPLPAPAVQQQAPAAPATIARRQAPGADNLSAGAGALGGVAKSEEAREAKAKSSMMVPPSIWRNTGDGVWVRVPAGDTASRTDSLSVRYTPRSFGAIALVDANGRRVAVKAGRIGEGLEFAIPTALLQSATGDSVTVSITEGSRSTFLKILLRNP